MFKVSQIFIYVCCNISFQRKQVEKFKIAYYFSICWKEGLFKSEIKRTGKNTGVFVILRMLPQESCTNFHQNSFQTNLLGRIFGPSL